MTPVIFRKSTECDDGEIVACFPTIPGSPGCGTCYAHLGQHSSYSREWYLTTQEASKSEFMPLLQELISIGYDDLRRYRREQGWMRIARREAEKSTP